MKVIFYVNGTAREDGIALPFVVGARKHGVQAAIKHGSEWGPNDSADLSIVMGLKGVSKRAYDFCRANGRHVLLIDKGYTRRSAKGYVRASLDAFQPLVYFRKQRPGDRWDATTTEIMPARHPLPNAALFAGSSQKFCDWHGLGNARDYAARVLAAMQRTAPHMSMVYRPKPSWAVNNPDTARGFDAVRDSPIDVRFSSEVTRTGCVVTYGSNAALEALLCGVPAICLGPSIAAPITSSNIADLARGVPMPSQKTIRQLCNDLAYCQFTAKEFSKGIAWEILKEEF